jgi:hypothetical protein
MPRTPPNWTALEGRFPFPTEARPLPAHLYPPEQSGSVPVPGDLADRHSHHWELAWIDLGGEG